MLSDVNINGNNALVINSQGVPLDSNLNSLQSGANAYITLNSKRKIQITPVTALVRLEE